MKTNYLWSFVVTLFFLVGSVSAQTTIADESLRDGSLPTGWTESDVSFQTAAGGYARFDEVTSTLTSPTVDASAFSSVEVDFDVAKFGSGADGPISLEYSLDGGTTWVDAGDSPTPDTSTYLSASITITETSADMQLRFNRADSPSDKRMRDLVVVANSNGGGGGQLVGDFTFPVEAGPFLVAQGTGFSLNINDTPNSANVPETLYDSFVITVDWVDDNNAFSNEADLTVITAGGSTLIDPPTSGGGTGAPTTLTFEGEFQGLYDPATDGVLDLDFNQSWNGSSANWSNVTVQIFEVPTCDAPENLSVVETSIDSAEISWDAVSNASSYNWIVVNAGDDVDDTDNHVETGNSTTTTADVQNLMASSTYDFYVSADCGATDGESLLSDAITFSTACGAIGDFENDFGEEDTGDVPLCWTGITNSTGTSPNLEVTTFSSPGTGGKQVRFQSSGDAATEHFLISPPLNNLSDNDKRLRISARQLTASHANVMEVGTMSNPNDQSTFTAIETINFSGNTLQDYFIVFSEIVGADHFAFRVTFSQTFSTVLLDRVVYEDAPSCIEPTSFQSTNSGTNSVDLEWSGNDTAVDYEVKYSSEEFFDPDTEGDSLIVDGDETTTTVTGLDQDTAYEFYVRTLCADEEESIWSDLVMANTLFPGAACGAPIEIVSLPYNVTDDTDNYGNFVSSSDRPSLAGAQVSNGTGTGTYLNGNEAVYSFTPANDGIFNVDISGTVDDWVGLWMFQGCPFDATVGYHVTTSGTERSLPELNLEGGTEYFIVISTWPPTTGVQSTPYTLNVEEVLCAAPPSLALDFATSDTAAFNWGSVNEEENGYEYFLMEDGDDPDVDDSVQTGTTDAGVTNISLSGLTSETDYEFFVRALCAGGTEGDFSSIDFTTACASAPLNYEEDFTGFTFNLNTGSNSTCWAEGTGFFDTVANGQWGSQNFNNDSSDPNGTALYINLYNFSTGVREDWVTSQTIDLGAGSPDNILSYDVYVRPFSSVEPIPQVTDMGTHSVQVVISDDGGVTWDLATNSVATYDNNNIPNDLSDTEEVISLAGYSGEIQVGFYSLQETTTPDLRFYIDNLFVGLPPSCDAVTGLTVSNQTQDSADLSWDEVGNAVEYTWMVFEDGDDVEVDTPAVMGTTSMTNATASGLDSQTSYFVVVQTDCDADGESDLSDLVEFSTLCAVQPYPFFETFEDDSNTRDCWIQIQEDGSGNWTFAAGSSGGGITTAFDGSLNARFVSQNGTDSPITKLVTPEIDLSDLSEAELSFYYGQEEWFGDQNELKVYYRTASDQAWVEIAHYTDEASSWTEETLLLPETSATMQIAFEGINNWGRANVVDNVSIDALPDPVFTNVQVIHNSPDPAATSVDVYLDGQLLPDLTGVNFREATEFLLAPAGVDFTVDVVPAGADLSQSVHTQVFNLEEDENYIIVANGVLDTSAFETSNAFELTVYEGARLAAVEATEVDVLVHHGSPDAPAVDVNESDAGNLVTNIAYPEFQGYLSLAIADYTLEIAATGNPEALVAYLAPLATLGGFDGQAITVIASGFFGDDADMDNEFGLWVATAAGGPLVELPLVEMDEGPMDPAPTPTEDEEDVISLFSNAYTDVPVDTFLTPWSSAQLEDLQIQGVDTKRYFDLDFAGIETVANPIDATSMDFFHIDVWSANVTEFRIKLVDLGDGTVEGELAFDIAQNEWVSLQIPLEDFADADLVTDENNLLTVRSSIQQLIISGFPTGDLDVYIDNIYFSEDPTVSTIDFDSANFTYYPNPVKSSIHIEAKNVVEQVEVFNMLGQRVLMQRPNQTNPSLDMSQMESGVYMMKVSINGADKTFQIIKD